MDQGLRNLELNINSNNAWVWVKKEENEKPELEEALVSTLGEHELEKRNYTKRFNEEKGV